MHDGFSWVFMMTWWVMCSEVSCLPCGSVSVLSLSGAHIWVGAALGPEQHVANEPFRARARDRETRPCDDPARVATGRAGRMKHTK